METGATARLTTCRPEIPVMKATPLTFRIAERVSIRDGKLQSSEIIYDAGVFPAMP
jgi:hypothetical protein